MVSNITKGVKVMVENYYQEEYSNPLNSEFTFAYRITIENNSNHTIQLLRRHWYIMDANQTLREVEGEGVVGAQPILRPGEKFKYQSWCPLNTEVGKMHGTFLMQRMDNEEEFRVHIPEFHLICPARMS